MTYNTVTQSNLACNTITLGNIALASTSSIYAAGNSFTKQSNYPLDIYGPINLQGAVADILINGQSLKDNLEKINQRLLILQPNPEYLEKYQALKNAYDHYKMLEALCFDKKQ